MASISHLAAGALCGAAYSRATGSRPVRTMAAFAFLGLSPDLDFFALEAGLSGTPLGHRGLTHSFAFSIAAGVAVGWLATKPPNRLIASILAVLALFSHAMLDAMSKSEPGPQLLWPFSSSPIVAFWRPIPAVPFYQEYFTTKAIPVFAVEALWCIPFLAAAAWLLLGTGSPSPRSDPSLATENN